jgi:hypothetical protein
MCPPDGEATGISTACTWSLLLSSGRSFGPGVFQLERAAQAYNIPFAIAKPAPGPNTHLPSLHIDEAKNSIVKRLKTEHIPYAIAKPMKRRRR